MTQLLSIEFLVAALIIINCFLVIFIWIIIRRVNRICVEHQAGSRAAENHEPDKEGLEAVCGSSRKVLDLLESLVREATDAAQNFEDQIKEKRTVSKKLNKALDSRIISINLLLSRSEALQKKFEEQQLKWLDQAALKTACQPVPFSGSMNILDQQNRIIDLYHGNKDVDTIAQTLSIPKEEVRLVIDLKEKFRAMEQETRE